MKLSLIDNEEEPLRFHNKESISYTLERRLIHQTPVRRQKLDRKHHRRPRKYTYLIVLR